MSDASIVRTVLGNSLKRILELDDLEPGDMPSYAMCKTIYVAHPLGQKMAEAPITVAQSQARDVSIPDAPDEVLKAFLDGWAQEGADEHIKNTAVLSRVYGVASVIMGCKGKATNEPLPMDKLWDLPIFFNVLDPLNTAGSLVLNQVPGTPDFQKPITLRTNGDIYHPSRFRALMHEAPVYIEYTASGFGYVGRSVYQRALYPLKTFIESMRADDSILTKLVLLIAKTKAGGSIIDGVVSGITALKRLFLKSGKTGNVVSIDVDEDVATLNMQNVDGAGTYARTNCLKNIATAADMPAKMLENETMVSGFGEGTEDAKNNARYIDTIRKKLKPLYDFFDTIVQYRAWNPEFYQRIQALYPDKYGKVEYQVAFSEWREKFSALWPSLLTEPPSETIKVEEVKLEACIAAVQTFMPLFDPSSQLMLLESAIKNISSNKQMFPHGFEVDWPELKAHIEEQAEQAQEDRKMLMQGGGEAGDDGVSKKLGRFDSAQFFGGMRRAVARLPSRERTAAK